MQIYANVVNICKCTQVYSRRPFACIWRTKTMCVHTCAQAMSPMCMQPCSWPHHPVFLHLSPQTVSIPVRRNVSRFSLRARLRHACYMGQHTWPSSCLCASLSPCLAVGTPQTFPGLPRADMFPPCMCRRLRPLLIPCTHVFSVSFPAPRGGTPFSQTHPHFFFFPPGPLPLLFIHSFILSFIYFFSPKPSCKFFSPFPGISVPNLGFGNYRVPGPACFGVIDLWRVYTAACLHGPGFMSRHAPLASQLWTSGELCPGPPCRRL